MATGQPAADQKGKGAGGRNRMRWVLLGAFAILVVRYASWTYPSVIRDKHSEKPLPEGKTPRPEDDELA